MIFIIKNFYDSFDNFEFSKRIYESKIFKIGEAILVHETFILEKSDEKDGKEEYEPGSFDNTTILNFNEKLNSTIYFFFIFWKIRRNPFCCLS